MTIKVGDKATVTIGDGTVTLKVGDNASISMTDGAIDIEATTLTLNGKVWEAHTHTGVAAGSAHSGGVTP